jgi:glycosyltransferase involved in cell wall biosynthesis
VIPAEKNLRIALFDYQVVRTNPIGGCHLRMLRALAERHEFTVFSVQFDNPCPERIKWVRVPAPLRPLPLLFVVYHLLAPLLYVIHRLRTRRAFDLVQTVESKLSFGDLAYTHFCHTSYLKNHWQATQSKGLRGLSRWLDHRLHALFERRIYRLAKQVLVPSKGLATELAVAFPVTAAKVRVLPNAIDVEALRAPSSFNRNTFRVDIGLNVSDVVFVFAALGHFERKGLPLLIEALARPGLETAKLLVVGGATDLIEIYRARAEAAGLKERVSFAGMQLDVRPYLWAADAFVLASTYETFSLVAFEAAAASLPLITPALHGIEEIVTDGATGFVVSRTIDEFAAAMKRFIGLSPEQRAQMGTRARSAAMKYDESLFADNWRRVYSDWTARGNLTDASASPAGIDKDKSMQAAQ